MTSIRLGPLPLAIILATGIAAGACAKNNNAQLAELQVELRAEREFLRETRAELQAMMTRLEPLLAMLEQVKAGTLGQEFSTEDAAGMATEATTSDGIAKTGPTHYRISRTHFEELLGNPTEMARGARIMPSIKNGQADGFKLYAIRPGSIFAKLGLQNGDTIQRVNNLELNSPEKALEVYSELRTATHVHLELTRRGQPITLSFTIQ